MLYMAYKKSFEGTERSQLDFGSPQTPDEWRAERNASLEKRRQRREEAGTKATDR
jgi:hypothetical protein